MWLAAGDDGTTPLLESQNIDVHIQPPLTRSAVAGALVSVADTLLEAQDLPDDLGTKLRVVRNYADSLFSASDYNRLRDELKATPLLVEALKAHNFEEALTQIKSAGPDGGGGGETAGETAGVLLKALGYARTLNDRLNEEQKASVWGEIELLCELADN